MTADGLDAAGDAIWNFVTTLFTDFFGAFLTDITDALFGTFFGDVLGGFSAATIFTLLLMVMAMAFFLKFIWVPLMYGA